MSEREYIDEWYKQKIEGLSLDPGQDSWDRIENTLDGDLVWDRLNDSLDVDQVWNKLEDSLDIDEVWTRLDASLDDRNRKVFYYRLWGGLAASLVLLMGLSIALLQTNAPTGKIPGGIATLTEMRPFTGQSIIESTPNQDNLADATPDSQKENGSIDGSPNAGAVKKVKDISTPNIRKAVLDKLEQQFIVQNVNNDKGDNFKDNSSTPSEKQQSILPNKIIQARIEHALVALQSEKVSLINTELPYVKRLGDPLDLPAELLDAPLASTGDPEEKNRSRDFFLGGTMGVKNQWLLSHDTYASFKQSELQTAKLDFSGTMGVNAGMMISEKVGLQTDFVMLSSAGQKYSYVNSGRNIDRELDFNYQSLMVATRLNRKEGRMFHQKLVDHFNLGLYGGKLVQATEQITGASKENVENAYKTYDFGLSVGYGVDVLATSGVMAGFALRLQQGLVNTYEGTTFLPSSLNPTYNTSVDFIFNLRYAFRKK